MKILIACEFSGIVREAFRSKGHEAWSCDLLPTEIPSQYHYQGDVMEIINDNWDMMIAHPPCTYLANSGVRWFSNNPERFNDCIDSCNFFNLLLSANIKKICIENPIQHCYARKYIRKYDQIIQPYYFGDQAQKATCLWLINLTKLKSTNIVDKGMIYVDPRGNKHGGVYVMRAKKSYSPLMLLPKSNDRWKIRSRTFPGIAQAMADQWG